jgi:hypothetical protein
MEGTAAYRQLIKEAIRAHAWPSGYGEGIEVATIFDDETGNYQLVYFGWDQGLRVYTVLLHVRLHNGKVWIERDGTAEGIATDLLTAGIPREEIVLAFHSPWKRQFTEFAVA